VKLDWGKVAGLAETLGNNGVCSNYSPEHATYTWDCLGPGLETAIDAGVDHLAALAAPQKAAACARIALPIFQVAAVRP
jgi:sulfide:quinone oxidoreductase